MINRGYKFSPSSEGFILTLTEPLQDICYEGLDIANSRKLFCPDFSITRGFETASEQFKLFLIGRKLVGNEYIKIGKTVTNCDGYDKISDHQQTDINGKAFAFDFCAYVNGTNYDDHNMALIATCFFEAASNQGKVIDWGGNYRSLSDSSHISLVV